MDGNVLVINCGSSSIKFAVIVADRGTLVTEGVVERLFSAKSTLRASMPSQSEESRVLGDQIGHDKAMQAIVALIEQLELDCTIVAVGHRVVHGGEAFAESVIIDSAVMAAISDHQHLAPLHNPANIKGIEVAQAEFPGLTHVAVFDTAFHQTMPAQAYLYGLPYELYTEHGVRRYGFHGSSHRYVTTYAAKLLAKELDQCNFISAHLGNGCSVCAVRGGKSVDTSMGMTPLEGLLMGTRCGDLDPSLPGFLQQQLGYSAEQLSELLNKRSGLLGLSGLSNDCRALEQAAIDGDQRAKLALDIFCYRLAKYIAGYTVVCGSLDALILTGGIGENSAYIRHTLLELLAPLGFYVDPEANRHCRFGVSGKINTTDTKTVLVIPTNEEWVIAKDAARLAGQRL